MAEVGCDVSQEWVDLGIEEKVTRVTRTREELRKAFAKIPPGSRVLVEPTGRYHRVVVECARRAGHEVKLVDPYAFSLYRRSKKRASTDKICALMLARYAEKEWGDVPEYKPLPKHLQEIKDLLELRDTHVSVRVALQQALSEIKPVPPSSRQALASLNRAVKDLDLQIFALVKDEPLYKEFLRMDGVGPTLAPALVWLFRAFTFSESDQAVAFLGMDVRVRESGKYVGQRKLTKRGSPLMRRLLHCGASSLRRVKHFQPLFAKCKARGMKAKGTNLVVARKILRAAYAIACNKSKYDRAKFYSP